MLPEFEILRDTDIPAAVRELLGTPNRHASRGDQWRYGAKGSLCVDVAAGRFMDFETGEGGGLLDLIRHVQGGSRADAAHWLGLDREREGRRERRRRDPASAAREQGHWTPKAETKQNAAARPLHTKREAADNPLWQALWREAVRPEDSPVSRYLEGRGLMLPAEPVRVLRYHPACPFGDRRGPAMLALIRNAETGQPQGLHRTPLTPAGDRARGTDREKLPKMMLGTAGGGAVMLSPDWQVEAGLAVAEGIETALAGLKRAPWLPTWAALSAGGVRTFPLLSGIEALTVYADADAAGIEASRALCRRYAGAGRFAELVRPKREGADMADLAA